MECSYCILNAVEDMAAVYVWNSEQARQYEYTAGGDGGWRRDMTASPSALVQSGSDGHGGASTTSLPLPLPRPRPPRFTPAPPRPGFPTTGLVPPVANAHLAQGWPQSSSAHDQQMRPAVRAVSRARSASGRAPLQLPQDPQIRQAGSRAGPT